jgi:hypothetical protein
MRGQGRVIKEEGRGKKESHVSPYLIMLFCLLSPVHPPSRKEKKEGELRGNKETYISIYIIIRYIYLYLITPIHPLSPLPPRSPPPARVYDTPPGERERSPPPLF